MHLISFLGTGRYECSNYIYGGKECCTRYFAKACREFFNPEKIYIVWTVEAKSRHNNEIVKEIEFEEIIIPYGKTEDELYNIFEIITSKIPENSEIVIDVTHGFRSQPMIMLSVAIYLRLIKSVKIKDIIYGAFEARDDKNNSPVFSLKPFLDIIDWTGAADFFIKRNDSTFLRDILARIHSETYIEKREYKATGLKKLGENLKNISDSFALIRPRGIAKGISEMNERIENAKKDIENIPELKPFINILEKIREKYNLLNTLDDNLFSTEGLDFQKKIIKLYLDNNQYQQAITLAREYLLTLFCLKEKLNPIKREERCKVERILGGEIEKFNNNVNNYYYSRDVAKLWNQITEIRNEIAHAGMKEQEIPADTSIKRIEDICNRVIAFDISKI